MTLRTRTIDRRYRLERRLELDASIESWLGFDLVLHRSVVVTMPREELLRDRSFNSSFARRSQIATTLHHRGIVAAFDSGSELDRPYLVTEYLGGESLSAIIHEESPFDPDDIAILIAQVASALDHAHVRGFGHGELDSDSIIVDDRGVAKVTRLGLPLGAPQRDAEAAVSVENDIRALAAIAFEMATGERPRVVDGKPIESAYQLLPDLPRNVSDVIDLGLGRRASAFPSITTFARMLSDWRSFDPEALEPEPAFVPQMADSGLPAAFDWKSEWQATPWTAAPAFPSPDEAVGTSRPPALGWWVWIAMFCLAAAACMLVWHGMDGSTGASPSIPHRLASLAQTSRF